MKCFLYTIKGLPRLEEYVDRNLICSSTGIKEDQDTLILNVSVEEIENLSNLTFRSTLALEFDFQNGTPSQFKYYAMSGYEVQIVNDYVNLVLYVSEV